jgi:Secretion system C-terminal sorting domain
MKKKIFFLFAGFIFCLHPSNSQESWVELVTGTTSKLNSISSVRNTATWVCGENATIIKSVNSGDSWVNANYAHIPNNTNLLSVTALNKDIAFVAGISPGGTSIFRTVDGGLSWQEVYTAGTGRINGIYMQDLEKGIAAGEPMNGNWVILKTSDGGYSWHPASTLLPRSGSESGFANSLWGGGEKFWFGTNNNRIYSTMNLGNSWSVLLTGKEQNTKSIWFDYNFNIGYSGSSNLIRTSNTGNSWNIITVPGTAEITGVTGSGMARLNWLVRNENKIYYSSDYGTNWNLSYTAPNGVYRSISIEKNGFFGGAVFALRDNGGITRTFFLVNSIEQISGEIPASFILGQNFPNPFNPLTKIRFSVPKAGFTTLMIFNSIGQVVETPHSNTLNPGVYEVTIDASAYSSGVYFYSLTSGSFAETKKMLVVK